MRKYPRKMQRAGIPINNLSCCDRKGRETGPPRPTPLVPHQNDDFALSAPLKCPRHFVSKFVCGVRNRRKVLYFIAGRSYNRKPRGLIQWAREKKLLVLNASWTQALNQTGPLPPPFHTKRKASKKNTKTPPFRRTRLFCHIPSKRKKKSRTQNVMQEGLLTEATPLGQEAADSPGCTRPEHTITCGGNRNGWRHGATSPPPPKYRPPPQELLDEPNRRLVTPTTNGAMWERGGNKVRPNRPRGLCKRGK